MVIKHLRSIYTVRQKCVSIGLRKLFHTVSPVSLRLVVSKNVFILKSLALNVVDAGNVQYLSRSTDAARIEDISFLVLGRAPPVVQGLNFELGAD
jgi:hypothetical protein